MQTYSFSNIDKFSTAGLVTRMTTDVTNVQNAYQMIIRIAVRAPLMLICSMAMCFAVSGSMSTIFLAAIVLLGIVLGIIVKKTMKVFTEAFKKYDSISNPKRCNMDVLLRYIGGGKLFGICSNLFNVLEYAADREEIAHAVQELKNSGALSALMTGSGSAVFGVFPDIASAQTAAEKLSGWSYKCVCQPVKQGWEFVY